MVSSQLTFLICHLGKTAADYADKHRSQDMIHKICAFALLVLISVYL
jgi:hypothetical protein